MQFTIKEPNVDPKLAVIEKTGHTVEFTLSDIDQNKKHYARILTEIKAKRDVEAYTMKNIEEHHPEILEMDPMMIHTAHMYEESKLIVAMADDKIKEIEDALAEQDAEVAQCLEQIPELASIPSPVELETQELKSDDSDTKEDETKED